MPTYTQTGRALSIVTPLGRTPCSSKRSAAPSISELFRVPARTARREGVDFDSFWSTASITLELPTASCELFTASSAA